MAILWGDVARGFTGALREDYKKTRERNERIIDAGINRAVERGTRLYDQRKADETKYQERFNYLSGLGIGQTPNHIALIAGLGDDDYDNVKTDINEFFKKANADVSMLNKRMFDDYDVAREAIDISANDVLQRIFGTPALTNALTPSDQKDITTSTLRSAYTNAGIAAASPSWLQTEALDRAVTIMPEVSSREELQRILEQGGSRGALDAEGVTFTPPGSLAYELEIERLAVTNDVASINLLIAQKGYEDSIKKVGDGPLASLFKTGPLSVLDPDEVTEAEVVTILNMIEQMADIKTKSGGKYVFNEGQIISLLDRRGGDIRAKLFTEEGYNIVGDRVIDTPISTGVVTTLSNAVEDVTGQIAANLNVVGTDSEKNQRTPVLKAAINRAEMPAGTISAVDWLVTQQNIRNQQDVTVMSLIRANANANEIMAITGINPTYFAVNDEGFVDIEESKKLFDGALFDPTNIPENLRAGNVRIDLSNNLAALTTLALFYNRSEKGVAEPFERDAEGRRLPRAIPITQAPDGLFEYSVSGLGPTELWIADMIGYIYANIDAQSTGISTDQLVSYYSSSQGMTDKATGRELYDNILGAEQANAQYTQPLFVPPTDVNIDNALSSNILISTGDRSMLAENRIAANMPIPENQQNILIADPNGENERTVSYFDAGRAEELIVPNLPDLLILNYNATEMQGAVVTTMPTVGAFELSEKAGLSQEDLNNRDTVRPAKIGDLYAGLPQAILPLTAEEKARAIDKGITKSPEIFTALTPEDLLTITRNIQKSLDSAFDIKDGELVYGRNMAILKEDNSVVRMSAGNEVRGTGSNVSQNYPIFVRRALTALGNLMGQPNRYLSDDGEVDVNALAEWLDIGTE